MRPVRDRPITELSLVMIKMMVMMMMMMMMMVMMLVMMMMMVMMRDYDVDGAGDPIIILANLPKRRA